MEENTTKSELKLKIRIEPMQSQVMIPTCSNVPIEVVTSWAKMATESKMLENGDVENGSIRAVSSTEQWNRKELTKSATETGVTESDQSVAMEENRRKRKRPLPLSERFAKLSRRDLYDEDHSGFCLVSDQEASSEDQISCSEIGNSDIEQPKIVEQFEKGLLKSTESFHRPADSSSCEITNGEPDRHKLESVLSQLVIKFLCKTFEEIISKFETYGLSEENLVSFVKENIDVAFGQFTESYRSSKRSLSEDEKKEAKKPSSKSFLITNLNIDRTEPTVKNNSLVYDAACAEKKETHAQIPDKIIEDSVTSQPKPDKVNGNDFKPGFPDFISSKFGGNFGETSTYTHERPSGSTSAMQPHPPPQTPSCSWTQPSTIPPPWHLQTSMDTAAAFSEALNLARSLWPMDKVAKNLPTFTLESTSREPQSCNPTTDVLRHETERNADSLNGTIMDNHMTSGPSSSREQTEAIPLVVKKPISQELGYERTTELNETEYNRSSSPLLHAPFCQSDDQACAYNSPRRRTKVTDTRIGIKQMRQPGEFSSNPTGANETQLPFSSTGYTLIPSHVSQGNTVTEPRIISRVTDMEHGNSRFFTHELTRKHSNSPNSSDNRMNSSNSSSSPSPSSFPFPSSSREPLRMVPREPHSHFVHSSPKPRQPQTMPPHSVVASPLIGNVRVENQINDENQGQRAIQQLFSNAFRNLSNALPPLIPFMNTLNPIARNQNNNIRNNVNDNNNNNNSNNISTGIRQMPQSMHSPPNEPHQLNHSHHVPVRNNNLLNNNANCFERKPGRKPSLQLIERMHNEQHLRGLNSCMIPANSVGRSGGQYFHGDPDEDDLNLTTTLTPVHLRKAKLMFFYTRYPNSSTIKTFFPEVRFFKNNTAQLVKWFSNFREFFYIQMEKYARLAISEGIRSADDLVVTTDSELYRTLNLHYNRNQQLEVPKAFLEVVQSTLREFFNALITGKDAEQSWKKPIYKIIARMDQNVPEFFRHPNWMEQLADNC